jgi:hypothetical protein
MKKPNFWIEISYWDDRVLTGPFTGSREEGQERVTSIIGADALNLIKEVRLLDGKHEPGTQVKSKNLIFSLADEPSPADKRAMPKTTKKK